MINVCFFSKTPTRQSFSPEQKFMAELSPFGRKVLLGKCWQAPKDSIVRRVMIINVPQMRYDWSEETPGELNKCPASRLDCIVGSAFVLGGERSLLPFQSSAAIQDSFVLGQMGCSTGTFCHGLGSRSCRSLQKEGRCFTALGLGWSPSCVGVPW